MRHLGSLIWSLLLAPGIWLLTGVGLVNYGKAQYGPTHDNIKLALGLLALLGAGVLFSLLALPRLAPIGPFLVGVAFLGLAGWAAIDQAAFLRALPTDSLDVRSTLAAPAAGVAVVLAVPLLITVLSPRRWRRFDQAPALHGSPAGPANQAPWAAGAGNPATPSYPTGPAESGYPGYPAGPPESGYPTGPSYPAGPAGSSTPSYPTGPLVDPTQPFPPAPNS